MKRTAKRLVSAALAGLMVLSTAGCGNSKNGAAEAAKTEGTATEGTTVEGAATEAADSSATASGKIPTITFYPSAANLSSGLVGGFKGEYFASRGFALDVWAYSDEKTNAILASGDLPDVMFIPESSLDIMIESGMLLNLDEYLDDMPNLQAYEPMETALNYIREYKSAGTGSVYGLTTDIGDNFARYKTIDSTERNALKLRWDVYEEIGAPEIKSMDDVLDVMEQMLKAHPVSEDGTPFYGTVLNNGSDSNYWANMVMWYRMQGYSEVQLPYLLEANMAEGAYDSILSKDSMYYKGLKWYNEAYRRGLMDPESINNDRPTQKIKVDEGYAMIPSGYLPGWAPKYYEYYVPGTKVYYNYTSTYGKSQFMIGINANTKNLDACLAFLDMMCDPEAFLNISTGPEGEFWEADENGVVSLTEAGKKHLETIGKGDNTSFTLSTGEELELWNTPWVIANGALTKYKDKDGNQLCCTTTGWPEVDAVASQKEEFQRWQKVTGYDNWKEWLNKENAYYSNPDMEDVNSFTSNPDDMMKLTIDAIKDKVVNASWQMVYAEDEAAFDSLWDKMVSDCEGLGAQEIIDWRLEDLKKAADTVKMLK